MRKLPLRAALALAVLLTAACDSATESREEAGAVRAPSGPLLSVGPTHSVQVVCPTKLQVQASGYCWAYGVDSLGFFTGATGGTFSTSTVPLIAMASNGNFVTKARGTAVVSAVVDGVTGSANIPIVNDVDPTVSISSPSLLAPGTVCTWTATGSGGETPYTYAWAVTSGSPTGSASGNTWTGSGTGSFTLKVTLTEPSGRSATATRLVNVLPGGPTTC